MDYLTGFTIFSTDLLLLHILASVMIRGGAAGVGGLWIGFAAISKFVGVGLAYYVAITEFSLDGMGLFLGSGSALVVYTVWLVLGEVRARRLTPSH